MLSRVTDAFVSIDEHGLVSYASPAFETLTRLPCDDIVGLSEAQLIERLSTRCGHALQAHQFSDLVAQHQAPGSTTVTKALLTLRPPHARSLELSVQQGTGASVSHLVHLRDVTREQELDRRMDALAREQEGAESILEREGEGGVGEGLAVGVDDRIEAVEPLGGLPRIGVGQLIDVTVEDHGLHSRMITAE